MNTFLFLKKSIISVILVLVLSFLIIQGLILIEGRKEDKLDVDYVIVPGARLYGEIPSPSLMDRLITTLEYAQEYTEPKIIVTGGQGPGETIPEAEAMKKFLVQKGISESRIIKEDKSTSTFENLKFSRDIIETMDERESIKVLVITSDFHILRTKMLANRLGFTVYGLPAETPKVTKAKSYLREYLAIIKSFIFDK